MPVRVTLQEVLGRRGVRAKDLAARIDLSETQLSLFRSGKVRGVRFSTVAALCAVLECRPGDLLDYVHDPDDVDRGAAPDDQLPGEGRDPALPPVPLGPGRRRGAIP